MKMKNEAPAMLKSSRFTKTLNCQTFG